MASSKVRNKSSYATSWNKFQQNGVVTSQSSTENTMKWTDTFSGTSNALWKAQVKGHTSATTGASGFRRNFSYGDGYYYIKQRKSRRSDGVTIAVNDLEVGGPQVLPGAAQAVVADASAVATAAAVSAAKMKMLSSIRSTYRQFQSGVFLGELRETLHQIRHPAEALRHGISSYHRAVKKLLRQGKQGNSRVRNRIVQDTWLEYVFGWKPLISDIEDLAKALAYKDYRQFLQISGRGKGDSATFFQSSQNVATFPINRKWSVVSSASCWLKGECGSSPGSTSILDTSRFGLGSWREALPTVWELIPYSFLVDYFTNIGDMIDGFATNTSGVRWINGTVRQENELVLHSVALNANALNASPWTYDDISFHYEVLSSQGSYSGYANRCIRFDRSAWTAGGLTVGLSDIQFRIPGVSSTKWLNIAALLQLRR